MGGINIKIVDEIKLLGLIIDKKLTFHSHVAHICRKVTNLYKQLVKTAKISWGLNSEIIRTIYVSVVEPIVLYAASVWASASQKITVQKHLNTLQRGFAQKICKAYRTVSLNSALILTGLLPLDVRLREAARLYEAKRGKPQDDILGDRKVEEKVLYIEAEHPAKEEEITFSIIEGEQPEKMEATKEQLEAVQIYTDGSKIDGKVGAALSVWRDNTEILGKKFKLESFCTVYQAELYALYQATELMMKHKDSVFNIYSDSQSGLYSLKSPENFHPLVRSIRKNLKILKDNNKTVKLFWVKAHAGHQGNERADYLAKEAALYKKTASQYDRCPISFIKRTIRERSVQEWNERYINSETATTTKMFFKNAETAYRLIRKIRPSPELVQILTGHGAFAGYLNRYKCRTSAGCVCDSEVEETVMHLLVDCPVYSSKRIDLEQKINVRITEGNIMDILARKTERKEFINFCEDIVKKVKIKNKS